MIQFNINNSIKQIAQFDGEVISSLTAIVRAFIDQAGGADVSSYAPGRINAWNGPVADLRKNGSFFKPAEWWCPELHQFCERLMPGYHACLVTYSGDGETGKGIGLHGDQSYAQFVARSINLQLDPAATTPWFMGQQYPGMAYSKERQFVARTRDQFLADEGVSLYQFELRHGSVVEFNCKNPHAAHPGGGRYSINLWKAANTQKAPARAAWDALIAQHGRSGGGKRIETGIAPVLPPALNFTAEQLGRMPCPPVVALIRPKQYYESYMQGSKQGNRNTQQNTKEIKAVTSMVTEPNIQDYFPSYTQANVVWVERLMREGKYRYNSGTITSHAVRRSDLMLISGGQDGGDEGGLMAGARLGLPTGGVAPSGWLVSTGSAQELLQGYGLIEGPANNTVAGDYRIRTILNARQADATIIFGSVDPERDKGSYLTLQLAKWYAETQNAAYCLVSVDDLSTPEKIAETAQVVRDWIVENHVRVLNVAGNRQMKVKGFDLDEAVAQCLTLALAERVREDGAVQFNCAHQDYRPLGEPHRDQQLVSTGFVVSGVSGGVFEGVAGGEAVDGEAVSSGAVISGNESVGPVAITLEQLQGQLEWVKPNLKTVHYQVLIDESRHFAGVEDALLFRAIGSVIERSIARLEPNGFRQAVFILPGLEDSAGWVAHAIAEAVNQQRSSLKAAQVSIALKVGQFEEIEAATATGLHVPTTLAITTMRDPNTVATLNVAKHPQQGTYGIVCDLLAQPGQACYGLFNEAMQPSGTQSSSKRRSKQAVEEPVR